MDDLSVKLKNAKLGCVINDTCINHLFYADDTVLMASSPYALQYLKSICEQYAKANELLFNMKKSVCMSIIPKTMSKLITVPNLYLNNEKIEWVSMQKYLGLYITCDNRYDTDIRRQVKSTYSRGNMIFSKFRKCSSDVKVQLFKSFCTSVYCSSLWCHFTKKSLTKL